MAKKKAADTKSTASIGFEAKLWLAADKLRNNMDAAEYKHVVLGLIFLKYISDSFEEHRAKLVEGKGDYEGANPENKDEYLAANVFWVPKVSRWSHLQANAKQPTIGKLVDDAMVAIEKDNQRLKGVLPKDYARPALDKHRLGELIDLIGTITLIGGKDDVAQAELSFDAGNLKASGRVETPALPSHRSVDLLGAFTNTFSLGSPARKVRTVASSIHRPAWCGRWLRCSRRTKAESTIRAVVRAACSYSRRSLSKRTVARSAISLSMVRKAMPQRDAWL